LRRPRSVLPRRAPLQQGPPTSRRGWDTPAGPLLGTRQSGSSLKGPPLSRSRRSLVPLIHFFTPHKSSLRSAARRGWFGCLSIPLRGCVASGGELPNPHARHTGYHQEVGSQPTKMHTATPSPEGKGKRERVGPDPARLVVSRRPPPPRLNVGCERGRVFRPVFLRLWGGAMLGAALPHLSTIVDAVWRLSPSPLDPWRWVGCPITHTLLSLPFALCAHTHTPRCVEATHTGCVRNTTVRCFLSQLQLS